MLDAYRHGIFPWPCRWADQWFVGWHSPDPRAILPLDDVRIPKRLQRKLRAGHFRFRWNSCFDSVLQHCASVGDRKENAWLCPDLLDAISSLHRSGDAHCIEVYDRDGTLCGGLYGIAVGAAFSAESMFHLQSDASKAAVCGLVAVLRHAGFELMDIQQTSPHLLAFGAVEIDRCDYLVALQRALGKQPSWPATTEHPIPIDRIGAED
ncbi:leucyl/phenylalanyl-tRNA--protein transferase [Rosistilla oblonga]|uniref:leucyl/phenylalanyl-tRNA--protein transferase n=1 Tax=Rosistilla oblonga TaxID=2527990 RepID=UPI003A97C5D3